MTFTHSSSDLYISVAFVRRALGAAHEQRWAPGSSVTRPRSGVGAHVVTEPYSGDDEASRLPGSRSLVLVRICSGLHCATKTRDHVAHFVITDPGCGSLLNPRLVKMLTAADRGLDDLAAFLDPEPSRGSVHDQRDVAPSLRHLEHSVVDAVTEQRALELPFALRCMYREKPANVAVTHAGDASAKVGPEDAAFGAGPERSVEVVAN